MRNTALICLSVVLFILGLWLALKNFWVKRKIEKGLPSIQQLEEISVAYKIKPATEAEVSWIAQLQVQSYSPSDAVPEHVLKEWYQSNPSGFFIIKMSSGEKVGHLDILPIKPSTLERFLEGKIVEKEIRGDSLYSVGERDLIRDIYVESVIVQPPEGYSKAYAMLAVLKSFTGIVGNICDPQNIANVYAMAASDKGENLMKKLGFEMISAAQGRADHHRVFVIDFRTLAQNISTKYGINIPRGIFTKKQKEFSKKVT